MREHVKTTQAFQWYLPLMFHPRDCQDDKILPEHIKINLKLSTFSKECNIKEEKVKRCHNPYHPREKNRSVCNFGKSNL